MNTYSPRAAFGGHEVHEESLNFFENRERYLFHFVPFVGAKHLVVQTVLTLVRGFK
jgi:hypothetical protein